MSIWRKLTIMFATAALMAAVAPLPSFAAEPQVGDANNDGHINIVDAQIVFDVANNLPGMWDKVLAKFGSGATQDSVMQVLDINGDGLIESADAFAVQCYVLTGEFGGTDPSGEWSAPKK